MAREHAAIIKSKIMKGWKALNEETYHQIQANKKIHDFIEQAGYLKLLTRGIWILLALTALTFYFKKNDIISATVCMGIAIAGFWYQHSKVEDVESYVNEIKDSEHFNDVIEELMLQLEILQDTTPNCTIEDMASICAEWISQNAEYLAQALGVSDDVQVLCERSLEAFKSKIPV